MLPGTKFKQRRIIFQTVIRYNQYGLHVTWNLPSKSDSSLRRWSGNSHHQFPCFFSVCGSPISEKTWEHHSPNSISNRQTLSDGKFIPKPSLTQLEFRLVKGTLWR